MADGRESCEWGRVYAVVRRWVDVQPEAVIPARYLPEKEPPPERTPEQRKAESDAAFRVMGQFFTKMQPR